MKDHSKQYDSFHAKTTNAKNGSKKNLCLLYFTILTQGQLQLLKAYQAVANEGEVRLQDNC